MDISYKDLQPDTLNNLLEEFVSREGTDYGHSNYSLEDKVNKVLGQLKSGRAIIVFDPESQSCHITLKE